MKYDVVIGLEGKEFRFQDVEAANQEAAETKCIQELKRRLRLVSIQPSPAVRNKKESNAKEIPNAPVNDIMDNLFGKFKN